MRALLLAVSVLSAATALGEPQPAAEPAKPLGVELTLRLGPAVAGGNIITLSETPFFPLWFGLGYRINGLVYVGASGVYAFGPSVTIGNASIGQYYAQALAEVAIHPLKYFKVDPWVGLGLGGEWIDGGNVGFLGSIEAGVDFALSQSFRLGPFFAVQIGVIGSDVHEWYVFGLQLTGLP